VNAPPKAACYNNDPELLKQAEAIGLESKEAITYCDLPALIRAKNDPVRRKVQERYDY